MSETRRLYAYFDADDTMADAEPEDKLEACVAFAKEFAAEQGCNEIDAEKLAACLVGLPNERGDFIPGPMAMVKWRLHICNIGALVRAKDEIWRPIAGRMPVVGKGGNEYEIALRPNTPDDKQVCLGLAVEKKGSNVVNNSGQRTAAPKFWTYSVVIPQTAERMLTTGELVPGYPMSLAYDVHASPNTNGDGKTLSGGWSRRMYIVRQDNALVPGTQITTNRLSDLRFGTNVELVVLDALIDAAFPVHTARINRQPVNSGGQAGWTPRGTVRPATPVAAAAVSVPGADPFEG